MGRDELDFTLCIFCSALSSYRCQTVLKPFPSTHSHYPDPIDQLFNDFKLITSSDPPQSSDNGNVTDLTTWLLQKSNPLILKPLQPDAFAEYCGGNKHVAKPEYTVQITTPPNDRFHALSIEHGTTTAFHGTHTENVYSILHTGLVGNLNKRALFGEGTYLSSDLGVALSFSKQGIDWVPSRLGASLMCVLVCDVINSDQVKKGKSEQAGLDFAGNKIPHNYFIVRNDEHVRVKEILVYVTKRSKSKSGLLNFLKKNIFYLMIVGYVAVLAFAGLIHSPRVKRWFLKF